MIDKLTILVCSCDSYEDLWYPFFFLFNKYWPNCDLKIILNTESKSFSFGNLDIRCFAKFPEKSKVPYGKRMIEHLKEIDTPYTLMLMDDFFIRKPVIVSELQKVIEFMDSDTSAVRFSFCNNDSYAIFNDKFPEYLKVPVFSKYKYNFQAAIWRTDYLLKSWRTHESPWDWELYGNYRALNGKYDFYVIKDEEKNDPIIYGRKKTFGGGVYRGKWVVDSVDKLFVENGINIDYNIRGIYKEAYNSAEPNYKTFFDMFNRKIQNLKSWGLVLFIKILFCRVFFHKDYVDFKRSKEMIN